jgi:ATP-dependent helicase/nuclease subunit B
VETLLGLCEEVAVPITADEDMPLLTKLPDDELFAMSSEFATRMATIAKRAHVTVNEPVYIGRSEGWLSSNPVLSHLEKNIFRTG